MTLPTPGTYHYATTGSEHINPPGGSRNFARTTPVTVRSAGCGIVEIWKPNPNHTDTRELCLHGHRTRLAEFSTTVVFSGVSHTETYRCGQNAIIYSPHRALGTTKRFTCSSTDSTAKTTVTPEAFTTLVVGGTSVRTLQVSMVSKFGGKSEGTSTQQLWFDPQNSLLVRNTGRVDTTQGTFTYHEHYTLMLDSLTPQ